MEQLGTGLNSHCEYNKNWKKTSKFKKQQFAVNEELSHRATSDL